MDKETKDIVKLIAGIQIESLASLKEEVKFTGNLNFMLLLKDLLKMEDDYLLLTKEDFLHALDQHIQLYVDIEDSPLLIRLLSEYQMMVCSHILFRMEDEWIQTNSQGVIGCWALFKEAQLKFHPELSLIKNK